MATESSYSDLPLSFIPNPITGDIVPLVNERSIKQSLRNLLLTPIGTKPFNPEYGTNIEKYLFEPADAITESELNEEIAATIEKFEPRVKLIAIESSIDENGIDIKIEYYVVNVPGPQVLEATVTRVS